MGFQETFDRIVVVWTQGYTVGLHLLAGSRPALRTIRIGQGTRDYCGTQIKNRRKTQLLLRRDIHEERWCNGMFDLLQRTKV